MKLKTILIPALILIALLALFVSATLVETLWSPADLSRLHSTSVSFNWTSNTSANYKYIPSYLLITDSQNESKFVVNQTILYCVNGSNSGCNQAVSGFLPGFYQWKVVSGDEATSPTVAGSNTGTFNTTDRPARYEGNSSFSAPFNTSNGKNTLNFIYWNTSTIETCNVTLDNNNSISFVNVSTSIETACNFTVLGTSTVGFQSNGVGTDEFITILNGNATPLFGFINGTNYTGLVNNTFNVSYSVNGTASACIATLTKSDTLSSGDAASNITTSCAGLEATNSTANSIITLTGTGYGAFEYLTVEDSSAMNILGFTAGTTYGTQTNSTSSARWFEIIQEGATGNHTFFKWKNQSGFEAMRLNKDTGDLVIQGELNASSFNLGSGNLSIGDKITFRLGEIIDNIVDGWIKITGNLEVTQDINVSGNAAFENSVNIGTGTQWFSAYLFGSEGIFNNTVPVRFTGAVDVDGNITGNSVHTFIDGYNIGSTPIPVQSVYANLSNVSLVFENGFSFDSDRNHTVAHTNGRYQINSQMTFSGTGLNEYHLGLGINGTVDNSCHAERKMGAAGDVGSASYTCIADIVAGTEITGMVENVDGANAINVHNYQMTIVRIGDDR